MEYSAYNSNPVKWYFMILENLNLTKKTKKRHDMYNKKPLLTLNNDLNLNNHYLNSPTISPSSSIPTFQPHEKMEQLYKASYEDPTLHRDMLADTNRMHSYEKAIHPSIFTNKTVLDVGCGTGILSMMSVDKGDAKFAIGVEFSEMAAKARKIVEENDMKSHVKIIYADVTSDEFKQKLGMIWTQTTLSMA